MKSNRKTRLFILGILNIIAIGLTLSMYFFLRPCCRSLNEAIEQRKQFHAQYSLSKELLKAFLTKSQILQLSNPTDNKVDFYSEKMFPTNENILSRIGNKESSASEAALNIMNYVQQHRRHTFPLFESNELHNPPRFFSVYGSGFCDDAATNMINLSKQLGLDARTVWIADNTGDVKHVVAEIFHDDKWRIYDADRWGSIRDGETNEVIDFKTLKNLIASGTLEFDIKEIFRTGTNKQIAKLDLSRNLKGGNPWLEILPKEQVLFFDKVWQLTTDGLYLKMYADNVDDFLQQFDHMGNFLRVVDISQINPLEQLDLQSYFPLSGAFLLTSHDISADIQLQVLARIIHQKEIQSRIRLFTHKFGVDLFARA